MRLSHKPQDTAGEITARRQSQAILCIMVELVRAEVLFSSSLAPRCEQIFPRAFCSGEFASSIPQFLIQMPDDCIWSETPRAQVQHRLIEAAATWRTGGNAGFS